MKYLTLLLATLMYMAGIVIAKGFWPVLFAITTPYGLYLFVEKIMGVVFK